MRVAKTAKEKRAAAQIKAAKAKIVEYIKGNDGRPLFVSVDGQNYLHLKEYLQKEMLILRVSDFCVEDSTPNWDDFINTLRFSLEFHTLCLGLGDAVSLTGKEEDVVYRLMSHRFPKKLVVLCRNCEYFFGQLANENPRYRRNIIVIDSERSYSVIQYSPNLQVKGEPKNFKNLLDKLESGFMGTLGVNSKLCLKNVFRVSSAYEAIRWHDRNFCAPETALTDEQWQRVLNGDTTWSRYLNGFNERFANAYEQLAFEQSSNFEEFERNIFHTIFKVKPTSLAFDAYYQLRKELVATRDEKYLAGYVKAANALGADGIYYLTDNTRLEFQAATELVLLNPDKRDVYAKNFPAARRYLKDYNFTDERLTDYFREYKEGKISNVFSKSFLLKIALHAEWRIYNELETRAALLERIGDGALYWMDGLSLDLLGYFRQRMTELGLQATIQIARAELPTLTSVNKTFYEEWPFRKFPKNERLDKLHHEARKDSVYFCDEIFIIEDALNEIATSLRSGDTAKVILTSDHGSSRGAVRCRGHPIKMHVSGEHGGRCCKIDERDVKPEFAVEANGYYVLTNYDRIQGGRMDGVELHGGATLEEVLVPVIEIFI